MRFDMTEKDDGKLLRSFLKEQGISAALTARLKRLEEGMLLNGVRVTVRAVLHTGDRLELAIEERGSPLHVLPRDLPFETLLETPELLAVNKPADMPTHPSHGHFEDTLANALAYRYTVGEVVFRPRFVNRLDRNTTGVVLVARHALAASRLSAAMAAGEIRKDYLALVHGAVEKSDIIESGIRRRAESIIFREVCPVEEGDYAKTAVEPLFTNGRYSLVKLLPETGRTHQLRVHMASVGHPLLGDDLYGLKHDGFPRHMLHAAKMEFPLPIAKAGCERITVHAPLPADMKEILKDFGEEVPDLAEKAYQKT